MTKCIIEKTINFYRELHNDEEGEFDQWSLIYRKIGNDLFFKFEYNEIKKKIFQSGKNG